mgnify:CR=1 FL=1
MVTWTVVSMDRDITQDGKADVVKTIHWRASDTDSDYNSGTLCGSVDVTLGSQSFIAYANIKESDAIKWAKDALGTDKVTAIEASIASQISAMKTPITASGVSW